MYYIIKYYYWKCIVRLTTHRKTYTFEKTSVEIDTDKMYWNHRCRTNNWNAKWFIYEWLSFTCSARITILNCGQKTQLPKSSVLDSPLSLPAIKLATDADTGDFVSGVTGTVSTRTPAAALPYGERIVPNSSGHPVQRIHRARGAGRRHVTRKNRERARGVENGPIFYTIIISRVCVCIIHACVRARRSRDPWGRFFRPFRRSKAEGICGADKRPRAADNAATAVNFSGDNSVFITLGGALLRLTRLCGGGGGGDGFGRHWTIKR